MKFFKKYKSILIWLILVILLGGRLGYIFFSSDDKSLILPGETTNGHHQIEQNCAVCHTDEEKENVFTS